MARARPGEAASGSPPRTRSSEGIWGFSRFVGTGKSPRAAAARAGPGAADGLREMVTPEGVPLRLTLASAGQRAGAVILDLLIMQAGFVALVIAVSMAFSALGRSSAELLAIVWLLANFLLRNAYFIAFELGPRAATPGKRVMRIRVAARSGGRLTADAIFVRNVMRELELYLPITVLFSPAVDVDGWIRAAALLWCLVFALLPLFNRDRLRVGDLLAGTWVVLAPVRRLPPDLARSGLGEGPGIAFTPEQLDAYGIKELQVLEDVLRRFDRKAVRLVADRIRAKIDYVQGEESDGAFLNAYYAALRARLEARALMGRRRADKHDRG